MKFVSPLQSSACVGPSLEVGSVVDFLFYCHHPVEEVECFEAQSIRLVSYILLFIVSMNFHFLAIIQHVYQLLLLFL